MATLHIIRGIPGSGKSTFAHKKFPGVLLLENDQYHMHNGVYDWHKENMPAAIDWCMNMVRMALENGMDCVVANTFTKRAFVDAYKKIAEETGASFDVDSLVDNFKKSMEDYPGEIIVE